jgi:hypothetical protein
MPIISLNKASHPDVENDIRINTAAVRFVEAAPPNQSGGAVVHMLCAQRIPVVEDIGRIVAKIGGMVPARRKTSGGASTSGDTIYLSPETISHLRPNTPESPAFWIASFIDGSEILILSPLPQGW